MIRKTLAKLRRFRKAEDGGVVTVEYVIIFPAFMFLILSAAELSLVTVKHGMLERALDMTVRDIRLGTGEEMQHDDLKDSICQRSVFINNCSANLRLEMIRQSPFVPLNLDPAPDCTDNSEEVKPVRNFESGRSNELMVIRACAKIDPVFPLSAMARGIVDATGQYALTATTAFVQEPL